MCIEIPAENNRLFWVFFIQLPPKNQKQYTIFKHSHAYLLAICVHYVCFIMPHYFSLGDRMIPGRQKAAGETCGQTHLQQHSPVSRTTHFSQSSTVWRWFDAWRHRQEPVTSTSPGGARQGTPIGALPGPCWGQQQYHFSAAPSLTLKVRRAKQYLWSHFAHLYRENTLVEGSALLTKPKITCRLSISEERRIIFLLSRAKAGHKLTLCKQRQALNSLDNLLQIICPALLINAVKHLEG